MDAKRYSLTYTRSYPPLERPDGEWVRASDYILILKENEVLREENEELTQWITAISNGHQQVPDWIKQSAKSLLVSQATKGE